MTLGIVLHGMVLPAILSICNTRLVLPAILSICNTLLVLPAILSICNTLLVFYLSSHALYTCGEQGEQKVAASQTREDGAFEQLQALQEVSSTLQSKLEHTQVEAEELRSEITWSEQQVAQLRASLTNECESNNNLSSELALLQTSLKSPTHSRDPRLS